MKIISPFILFVCFILVSSSCKYQSSNNNSTIDTLLAKTIIFPDSLLKLDGTQFQRIDSFLYEIEDKIKVISIIDAGCMECIMNQLNKIDSTFNSIMIGDESVLIFILNCSREDSVFFMNNLQPAIKATGTILWDTDFYFERQNHLFTTSINSRTFMVNNENEIIQYGNPILKPDVIFEYQERLKMNSSRLDENSKRETSGGN
ncbi:MAG: hypothetical protein R6U04_02920 [Bacteroidales bacterium]